MKSANISPRMAGSMPRAMRPNYDRALALFPPDVLAWVQQAQPKAWEALTKNHGAQAGDVLLARLREQMNSRGTLDVLRHGMEMIGLRQKLPLAQFKPALAMNPEILTRYAANRLRVVRQVRYSVHNENCIDLVLFLNGIPVATVELKTDFTQSCAGCRRPVPLRPAAQNQRASAPSRCLSFPSGALVHFAVSNAEVHMTTKLAGPSHALSAIQQGQRRRSGQPAESKGGHRTAYLWEEVWARESWLEILGRYLVTEKDRRSKSRT